MRSPCNAFFGFTHIRLNLYNSLLQQCFTKEKLNIRMYCNSMPKRLSAGSNLILKTIHSSSFVNHFHHDSNLVKAKFYSTGGQNEKPKNIGTHVKSAKAAIKKIKRKNTISQKSKAQIKPGRDSWSVVGYSTAESYDLYNLARRLAVQVFLKFMKSSYI